MAHVQAFDQRLPTEIDIKAADQLRSILASEIQRAEDGSPRIRFVSDGRKGEVVLSPALAETFLTILRLISGGKGFQVVPYSAELTTQQAADLLNVSRPYLIKLLEAGEIDFHYAGRHRRIKAEELLAYKAHRDGVRADALADLAKADAELGLL